MKRPRSTASTIAAAISLLAIYSSSSSSSSSSSRRQHRPLVATAASLRASPSPPSSSSPLDDEYDEIVAEAGGSDDYYGGGGGGDDEGGDGDGGVGIDDERPDDSDIVPPSPPARPPSNDGGVLPLAGSHERGVGIHSTTTTTTTTTRAKEGSSPPLTVRLSASSHPRAVAGNNRRRGRQQRPTTMPLVGIGVGNLPHHRVPYVLALALDAAGSTADRRLPRLGYRLVDASRGRADSALEVLVGRSLGRIDAAPSSAAGGAVGDEHDAGGGGDGDDAYHVMIKVWHTHLGYERTLMSVRDSLSDILPGGANNSDDPVVDVRVHAILQYPRCYDELFASKSYLESPNFPVKYGSCAEEEDALDPAVKDASAGGVVGVGGGGASSSSSSSSSSSLSSSSPLLDKDGAWKRSYRALEETYHRGSLESIGVGDFGPEDMRQLFELATVGPHVYQGSLRTLLTQEGLIEELVRRGVHYQCHDAASAVLGGRDGAPLAYARLERIGAGRGGGPATADLEGGGGGGGGGGDSSGNGGGGGGSNEDGFYGYSPIQVALGYLVRHRGVGVVPGTTDASHLAENSPGSLGGMRMFSPREVLDIETALLALVYGEDADAAGGAIAALGSVHRGVVGGEGDDVSDGGEEGGMVAIFLNALPRSPPRSVRMFLVHPDTGEQVQLSHAIPPGRSGRLIANVGDVLVAYDGYGSAVGKFLVEGPSGSSSSSSSGNESDSSSGSVDFVVEESS